MVDIAKLRQRASRTFEGFVSSLVDGDKWQRRIDGLAEVLSPAWYAKRTAWREYTQALSHRDGPFAAGNHILNNSTWNASAGSIDEKLLSKLPTIRNRVRELISNDPHAAAVTRAYVDHVVGSGVAPKPTPNRERLLEAGITDEQIDDFIRTAESVWREWVPHADSTGQCDFYSLQRLVERRVTEDGDVFLNPVMIQDASRPYELALEVIVADRIENPLDQKGPAMPYTRAGIQRDRVTGRPIKAWVRLQHPGDWTYADPERQMRWKRLVFRDLEGRPRLLQIFDKHEPGQTRGFPVLTPTLPLFQLFADTLRAECMAIKVQACFSAFIRKADAARAWSSKGNGTQGADGKRRTRLEAGTVEFLEPGEEVSFGNPTRPGGTFEPYVLRLIKTIAAGCGLSYELVSRDWTQTTYTSGRMAGLESKRVFLTRHESRINSFYGPVWCWLMEEAVLKGRVKAPKWSKLRDAWCGVQWHHRQGWPMVDPEKDLNAKKLAIELGLSSRRIECAELGRDPDSILRDEALDEQMRTEILGEAEPVMADEQPLDPNDPNAQQPADENVEDEAQDEQQPVRQQRPKEVIPA